MEITNPPQEVPFMTTTDGQKVQCRVVDIGAWDMDTNASTTVAHGMGADWFKIISITVVIYNDADTVVKRIVSGNDAADPNLVMGGVTGFSSVNITLTRRTGGVFDGASYNDGVKNRGKVFFWYTQ